MCWRDLLPVVGDGRPSRWTGLLALPLIVGSGIGIASSSERAEAQAVAQANGEVRVTHIGIVVRNIEHSAQAYADLVGINVPPIHSTEAESEVGQAKFTRLRLSNITIELLQPVGGGASLYRDFLETRGQGVHHIGFHLPSRDGNLSLTEQSSRLERHGGTVVSSGHGFEFVDLTPQLGLMVETMAPEMLDALYGASAAEPARMVDSDRLGRSTCVTHIGLVVRDIEQSREAYADLIGVDVPPIQQFDAASGPAEYAIFNLNNVSIELIRQIGDGPGTYVDFLETHGQRVHHIGLHLRGANQSLSMPEQIAWLEQHGGKTALDAGGFAYIDFGQELGLLVEALTEATNERVYPHPHPAL